MTEKMQKFVVEYMVDFNATQAAIRAGYSEKTAYSIGNENLKKPEIRRYLKDYIENELGMSEKITIENIRFWQKMRDNPKANEQARLKASEHLGKYNAMFTDRIQHTTIDQDGKETGFNFVEPPAYAVTDTEET